MAVMADDSFTTTGKTFISNPGESSVVPGILAANPDRLDQAIAARQAALVQLAERRRARKGESPPVIQKKPEQRSDIWRKHAGAAVLAIAAMAAVAGSAFWAGRYLFPGPTVERREGSTSSQKTSVRGLTMTERREVERLLAAMNFDSGPVDGRIDPRTRQAIARYWQAQGKTRSATVTPRLLTDLRAVAALMGKDGKNF